MIEIKSKKEFPELDAAMNECKQAVSEETHFTGPDHFAVRAVVDRFVKDHDTRTEDQRFNVMVRKALRSQKMKQTSST